MTAVGVLHPGEMGAAVGAVARADVWWAPEGRSEATAARAQDAGLQPSAVDELLRRCTVVLSICPPHAALDVARAVAAHGYGGIYCDANAVSPATAREVAAVVEARGATCVDGGIVGGPPTTSWSRLYLSGAEAAAVAAIFEGTRLEPALLDAEIGTASAFKMLYAGFTKGTAALLIALADAAEQLGLASALRAEWERSLPDVPEQLAGARRSAAAKGWRWVAEMREIAATLRAAGQPGGFHDAAAEVFERR